MYNFGQDEIESVVKVLNSKKLFRYLNGVDSEAAHFEAEFCKRLDVSYSLLVSSGTAALICSLAAMGIGPEDEVIIPGYTFVATALAPLALGATPVICEIDETLTIDPIDLESKIGQKTRAIIAVHMNGFPCNMNAILEIASAKGLFVLEDTCQAIGGSYNGRFLGTIGEMGTFSFNQFKILTAGEGGAIVTNNKNLFERAFIQHDGSCGFSPYAASFDEPIFAGWAFRATEITAAILRIQLQKLDNILADLRTCKKMIKKELAAFQYITEAPCHDPQGECATHIALQFPSFKKAKKFCHLASREGFHAMVASESRHVYSDWTMLLQKKGAHHPLRNPLLRTKRSYYKNSNPQTLDILSRTAILRCDPDTRKDS